MLVLCKPVMLNLQSKLILHFIVQITIETIRRGSIYSIKVYLVRCSIPDPISSFYTCIYISSCQQSLLLLFLSPTFSSTFSCSVSATTNILHPLFLYVFLYSASPWPCAGMDPTNFCPPERVPCRAVSLP